ncbi:MAG: hypothetical protein V3T55_06525 [Anaerolineales bacterium]
MLYYIKKRPEKMKPRLNRAPGLPMLTAVLALALASLSCNAPPALLSEFNLNGFAQESIAEVQVHLQADVVGDESPQSLGLILPSDNSASDAPSPTPFQPAESTTIASQLTGTVTVSATPNGSVNTPRRTPSWCLRKRRGF